VIRSLKTKTVTGKVVETIIVEKLVEAEVPAEFTDDQASDAIRKKAYDKIIGEPESGWELVETIDVDVKVKGKCPNCKEEGDVEAGCPQCPGFWFTTEKG